MLLKTTSRSAKIGLTPLIDVVFILLLFFMLTSQFVKWREVDLSNSGSSATSSLKPLRLQLLSEGRGWLCDQHLISELSATELSACSSSDVVVLDVSPEVSMQQIVYSLERLKGEGFSRVGLGSIK